MNQKSLLARMKLWIAAHKIATAIIVIIVIFAGYGIYRTRASTSGTPQYQLTRARTGSIVQTVTGTGQVLAANQLDVPSQVSGTIESIDVSVGQHVNAGDLIATIDPTNALNSLNNAKISLAKLTEAPKTTDLSNAQNSVTQSYSTAYNSISSLFLDLQTIMPGLNSLFYGPDTFLSQQASTQLSPSAQNDRSIAGMSYDKANQAYQNALTEYAALSRQSATSTITTDLSDEYALAKNVANALADTQNAITFITANQPNYQSKDAPTAASNVTTWSNTANSDVSSLLSAQTGITSAQNSLTNLLTSADPLDVETSEMSVQEAEQTYANYFIRAPFAGVVGRIPVNVYQQAGNGTVMATIVGDQKIATLSLDEVDAANVKAGDPVTLTFDAINGFTATGTVEEIDLVGTVSSGVVSYPVKVLIGTADTRINPGMSVNATIVTKEIDNVTVIPSTAVKTQGRQSYVQTFSASQVSSLMAAIQSAAGTGGTPTGTRTASSTAFAHGRFASSTNPTGYGSTTAGFTGTGSGFAGAVNRTVTVTTTDVPTNTTITTGQSDDTNIQVLTGVNPGDWVVTKTLAGTAKTTATASAPSLLSSLGGGGARGGFGGGAGGGAARAGGGAAAAGR